MRKVIIFLFALSLFSCRPSSNLPASESSASDSVELKKQEAWESAHRLDSVEALLAEEGNEHDAEAHGNRHTGLTVLKPYWRRKGMSMMLRHPLPTNLRDNIVSMN